MKKKSDLKIYFAASMRGGMDDGELYAELAHDLQAYGEVFSDYVLGVGNVQTLERKLTDDEFFDRDMIWLNDADVIIAEVTVPSLGVGFEIARAWSRGIPILCLYRPNAMPDGKRVSAIIAGCPNITLEPYSNLLYARIAVQGFLMEKKLI